MPSLDWIGKPASSQALVRTPTCSLEPRSGAGAPRLDGNLLIQGDNLFALKALSPYFAGQVKLCYMDPPYNTGNQTWVYNDAMNARQTREWLGKTVGPEDLTRSDKWLCMMQPRLQAAHALLRDDGVIVVSIDDAELPHLLLLLGEVFGPDNMIGCLPTIMNLKGNQDQLGFAGTHEYTVVWARDRSMVRFNSLPVDDEGLNAWNEDDFGPWKRGAQLRATGTNAPRDRRPNLFFPLFVGDGGDRVSVERMRPSDVEVWPVSGTEQLSWRWSRSKFEKEPHNVITVEGDAGWSLYKKQRPEVGELPSAKPKTLLYRPEYSTSSATNELKAIFGGGRVFPYPKPSALIEDLIAVTTSAGDIVLDPFGGSGTTGHAVLRLNGRASTGHAPRRFILCEMERDVEDGITRVRLERAIAGYEVDGRRTGGLGGSFERLVVGPPVRHADGELGEASYGALGRLLASAHRVDAGPLEGGGPQIGSTDDSVLFLFTHDHSRAIDEDDIDEIVSASGGRRAVVYATRFLADREAAEARGVVLRQVPYDLPIPA